MNDNDDSFRHVRHVSVELEAARIASTTRERETADEMCDRLRQQVAQFEAELTSTEEVGASIAHFGRELTIRLDDVGYHNPGLVIFYGRTLDEDEVRIIQHFSQVSVMLIRVRAADPANPYRMSAEDEPEPEAR